MTRYIFSNGTVQAADDVVQRPDKRRHPLRPTILFITAAYDRQGRRVWPPPGKEQPHDQQQPG